MQKTEAKRGNCTQNPSAPSSTKFPSRKPPFIGVFYDLRSITHFSPFGIWGISSHIHYCAYPPLQLRGTHYFFIIPEGYFFFLSLLYLPMFQTLGSSLSNKSENLLYRVPAQVLSLSHPPSTLLLQLLFLKFKLEQDVLLLKFFSQQLSQPSG